MDDVAQSIAAKAPGKPSVGPRWLLTLEPRAGAAMQLLCFHHAGGGAYGFRRWARLLAPQVELIAVQLPGREDRLREAPLTSAAEVIAGLLPEFKRLINRPYAVFGHSMGAVLAYLLAEETTRRQDLPAPARVFISSSKHPQVMANGPSSTDAVYDDATLLTKLKRLGGTPRALLEEESFTQMILPIVRADFRLLDAIVLDPTTVIDAPISVFRGAAEGVHASSADDWRPFTSASADERVFPGGHFYLHARPADVVGTILGALGVDAHGRSRD
jgi:surfactin synthase thioesterase subunit